MKCYNDKLKKITMMMLFFSLICVLSFSAVSGAIIPVSGNSFDNIQTEIDGAFSGDTIDLGNKNYVGSGSIITVTGNKNLIIQGQSNTNRATLDANNLNGTLSIRPGSSATIRYVNFVNGGNSFNTTHVIIAYGTILIENCNFLDSRGDSGSAIAVTSTAHNTIIRNCNFTNNYANNEEDNNYTAGGAIVVSGADNVQITNCYFSGNKALNYGGALTIRNEAINTRITSCTFVNNQAPNGGAIYNQNATGTVISGCTFTSNIATGSGGAIYSLSSLNINGSRFTSNSANNGGAIYSNNILSLDRNNFTSNIANRAGGSIYSTRVLNVNNCNFNSNSASNGGGIYSTSNLNFVNTNFTRNNANYGGAIQTSGSTSIRGSTFNLNRATRDGGAIYTTALLIGSNSNFYNNVAGNGGGIFSSNTLNLTSVFGNNNNASNGGFIYSGAAVNIFSGSFSNNKANSNGGVIYGTGTININGGTFSTNNARFNGGATYGTGLINIKSGAKFNSNTASNGGAIFSTNNLNIVSSSFTSNKASNGGSVYSSKLTVDNGAFYYNVAYSNGGAIYSNGVTTIKNKSILNSNTGNIGGAIFSLNTLSIVSSILNSNIAKFNGGAVYNNKALSVSSSTLNNNKANSGGGAVFSLGTTTIKSKSVLNNNNAYNGGAIFNGKSLTVDSSTLRYNKASNGGAIYSSKLTINKGTISNNVANINGGGIYTISTATIKGNTKFKSNSAYKGAASFSKRNKVTIDKGVKFENNKAGIGLSVSLPDKVVKLGKTKVRVKVGSYNNNVQIGKQVPLWSNNYKNVKFNGKTVKKYTLKNGTKFTIKVNGKFVKVKYKSKKGTDKEISTTPTYTWRNFSFTATYSGNNLIKRSSTTHKVSARIVNTDVHNVDMIEVLKKSYKKDKNLKKKYKTQKIFNNALSKDKKYKKFREYHVPYRYDRIQTKIGGKDHYKSIKQRTSNNAYFLGGEKVPADLHKFLAGWSSVTDVNETSIKNRAIVIFSLKSKKYGIKGKLTPLNKVISLQKWVSDNTNYESSKNYGGAKVLSEIKNNPKGTHANCVGYTNLFISLARTAGIPSSYFHMKPAGSDGNPMMINGVTITHVFALVYINDGKSWKIHKVEPQESKFSHDPWTPLQMYSQIFYKGTPLEYFSIEEANNIFISDPSGITRIPIYAREFIFLEDYDDKKPNFNLVRYISINEYFNLYYSNNYFKVFGYHYS